VKAPRTLVRQYVAFFAVFAAVLSLGAFLITVDVTRHGLEDLFRQRFEQAGQVLSEYARGRDLARLTELESVLGSPRFLAAVETHDPLTVGEAVPTHPLLAGADAVRVTDAAGGRVLFDSLTPELRRLLPPPTAEPAEPVTRRHVAGDHAVYEVVAADIHANNGMLVGRLEVVRDLGAALAEDLKRLTGLEVALALDGHVVDHTAGGVVGDAARSSDLDRIVREAPADVRADVLAGRQVLLRELSDPTTGFDVLFVGSVEDAIAPALARVRGLLLALAVLGGFVATGFAGWFTERRVGRQVRRLVGYTERISSGDLDFAIPRGSADELGYLAAGLERMRSELRRGREEIEAAHQARLEGERMAAVGQMATGIIHDFKSPMAVVQGTADLIAMRDPGNAKLAKQCTVIHRQVERMVALTRDVIEFARGDSVLESEEVDLDAYLEGLRDLHEEPFGREEVRLAVECPPGLRVRIDPRRMQRVLDNLLTNAREVSEPGQAVTLSCRREGDDVRIEVRDEGPGIPPDIATRLFEPFVTAGKKGGSGLGLAIARKIVEDHGATLTVASGQERGTTFAVTLPRAVRAGKDRLAEERTAP